MLPLRISLLLVTTQPPNLQYIQLNQYMSLDIVSIYTMRSTFFLPLYRNKKTIQSVIQYVKKCIQSTLLRGYVGALKKDGNKRHSKGRCVGLRYKICSIPCCMRYSCLAQVCLEETVEFSRSVGKKWLNKPFLSLNSTPGMMFIVIKQAKKAPVQSFPFISLKGTVYQKIKRVVNSKLRTANLPNSNVPSQTKLFKAL